MTKDSNRLMIIVFAGLVMIAATIFGQMIGGLVFSSIMGLSDALPVTPLSLANLWMTYGSTLAAFPKIQKSLVFATIISAAVPIGIAAMGGLMMFSGNKRELHGSARWATSTEIMQSGLTAKQPGKDGWPGIILGKYKGSFLRYYGQQFVALAAPTRSGKGVGVVIPNLLAYPHSVVVFDPKLENWSITAGFRQNHGQSCFLFAPDSPAFRSHRWNPLSYIRREKIYRVDDIQGIANILYSSANADANSAFFNEMAQTLFLGLVLYMLDTPDEEVSLANLVRLTAPSSGEGLHEWIQSMVSERKDGSLSSECANALMSFASNSDNTRSGILASAVAPLNIFRSPLVAAATSGDDFDLRNIRKECTSIYIGLQPNSIERFARLTNLFFSQLINENLKELPKDNPDLKYQCLLLMDEFTLLGRVGIIEKTIGIMAGYNIRPLLIFQSKGQIEDSKVYGKESARNILTNCGAQVIYAPREQQDANEASEMLGYQTVKGMSVSRPNGFFSTGKNGNVGSTSSNESKRALLMPQEIKEIGQAAEIISIENVKPILADKIRYFEDPVLADRANIDAPIVPLLDLAKFTCGPLEKMTANEIENGNSKDIINSQDFRDQISDLIGFDLAILSNSPDEELSEEEMEDIAASGHSDVAHY